MQEKKSGKLHILFITFIVEEERISSMLQELGQTFGDQTPTSVCLKRELSALLTQ